MVTSVGHLEWRDGVLTASAPELPVLAWTRPADLAEARLACSPPVAALALADGKELLRAAFEVVPFVRDPLPRPLFGPSVTPSARAAFALFLGQNAHRPADAFRVTRGEPGEFLVCARRYRGVWMAGGFTAAAMTLTVRFEDLWERLPKGERFTDYLVEVQRDPTGAETGAEVREALTGIAPDARICLDLAANGGFMVTFWPVVKR